LTIAAALAIATPWSGTAVAVPSPDIAQFTLANGLGVVVIPDRRTPVVTHMVWYRVGGADETAGKSGLAHFLEHLMFKGTSKNPQGLFSQTVAVLGGQENAFTSSDYTGYFQRVAREHLRKMMEFGQCEAGHARTRSNPSSRLLEEQNMRVANNPTRGSKSRWKHTLPQPPLWPTGDRLAPGNRGTDARGCARIL
jgi:zinc protease